MPSGGMDVGVEEFYRGKSVFITGGSGFMGKVLIEKLLYSCPGIVNIFIMMRPKREKSIKTRLEEMFKLPMFNRLRESNPEAWKKLVAIPGDMVLEELGMSKENRARVREEVSIVFHSAATLRLEATLKDAVTMNTIGTWRMIELCRGMPKLEVFVHLSTAFCHVDQQVLEEKVYDFRDDAHDIIRRVQCTDDKGLKELTPGLIAPHPNCYTYSKRLSEKLIVDEYPNMPMVIARPAIVTPAYQEPLPGWVDTLNGPVGLIVGAGKGVIRSMHCNSQYTAEVIPVDFAINGLITIAWKIGTAKERPEKVPVFNLTSSSVKNVSWGRVLEMGRNVIYKYPFEMTVWYPDGQLRSSKFMHNLCVIFLHFLPAYFIDFMMLIFRQKRFMVRIQWRIQEGLNVLQYFTTRQWDFKSENFTNLRKLMTAEENDAFSMAIDEVDDEDYMLIGLLGSRQYCMKEDPSSLPRCRRNMKILWAVDKLWSLFFYYMIFSLCYSNSETVRYAYDFASEQVRGAPVIRSLFGMGDASSLGHLSLSGN